MYSTIKTTKRKKKLNYCLDLDTKQLIADPDLGKSSGSNRIHKTDGKLSLNRYGIWGPENICGSPLSHEDLHLCLLLHVAGRFGPDPPLDTQPLLHTPLKNKFIQHL